MQLENNCGVVVQHRTAMGTISLRPAVSPRRLLLPIAILTLTITTLTMRFAQTQTPTLTLTPWPALALWPLLALAPSASVHDPSLQPRPPMGFNNWTRFLCALNQTLFIETADAMRARGLLRAGYEYVNLDDCWLEHARAADGTLVWNSTLFPDGLVWLGEELHARGFKYGIYQDAGKLTCGGYPGSLAFEELDAQTFADWGVDYVKIDGCNVVDEEDPRSMVAQFATLYAKWSDALRATGRDMVFSQSAPAYFSPGFPGNVPPDSNNTPWYEIMGEVPRWGELARHSTDIKIWGFDGIFEPGGHWESIMNNYGFNTLLARYQQRCGYYNDPDFLIPFPDLSLEEKKSQFSLWASSSAPLIISAYIPELSEEDVDYLTNEDIIAVDQDALCLQATLVSRDDTWDALSKDLANGDRLLTVLNRGNATASTSISVIRAGLEEGDTYIARDLWTGDEYEVTEAFEFLDRPTHSTAVYRISLSDGYGSKITSTPTGMIFNTFTGNCLTATSNAFASFKPCAATDTQVWRFDASGTISPVSELDSCLDHSDEDAYLQDPTSAHPPKFKYYQSGNLELAGSGRCLEEFSDGNAKFVECRLKIDSQVFGVPSGVEIIEK